MIAAVRARLGASLAVSCPFSEVTGTSVRWATVSKGGSTKNKKDNRKGKRLGVKKFGGEYVGPRDIIIRQKGNLWNPGLNVTQGRDFTLLASAFGRVLFEKVQVRETGRRRRKYRHTIHVVSPDKFREIEEQKVTLLWGPSLDKEQLDFREKTKKGKLERRRAVDERAARAREAALNSNIPDPTTVQKSRPKIENVNEYLAEKYGFHYSHPDEVVTDRFVIKPFRIMKPENIKRLK